MPVSTTDQRKIADNNEPLLMRHPVAAYFALTFVISWVGAGLVAAPHLIRHEPLPKLTGILMFPAMLLGPSLTGIVLTRVADGPQGIHSLFARMFQWRFPMSWYLMLFAPPALVFTVLIGLKMTVSSSYAPNFFPLGILFGVPAGYLEEIGWVGYAFPRMRAQRNALAASVLLGLMWSAWHLPVIDFLGAATPHGRFVFPFFLSFTAAMTAMRVLICWAYNNTGSVLLAQLIHISSTGALVIFSAPRLTPGQEVMWYGLYGAALWVTVVIVVSRCGKRLLLN
ncbi:MAG TPA: CPBP family intramembrane glutamic endopeptidase [Acidobacteriaceae bacterium]